MLPTGSGDWAGGVALCLDSRTATLENRATTYLINSSCVGSFDPDASAMAVADSSPSTSTRHVTKSRCAKGIITPVKFWTKLIPTSEPSGYLHANFQRQRSPTEEIRSGNLQAQKCWGGVAALRSTGPHQLGRNPATPEAIN